MTEDTARADMAGLTADIVAAYVSNNAVAVADLPQLISQVNSALMSMSAPEAAAAPTKREPAIAIKKSVTPDHLISLIDGRKYKSLKRHLSTNGMTPAEYRAEFGLPADYPMTSANYSAQRSALAKSLGLGRKAQVAEAAPARRRKAA